MLAQPSDEVEHVGVAPHPGREALESAERIDRLGVIVCAANVPVDSVGIRPIALDADGVESLLNDQPFGELRPHGIELVRAVRRLADQDDRRVADHLEEPVVFSAIAGEGTIARARSTAMRLSMAPFSAALDSIDAEPLGH